MGMKSWRTFGMLAIATWATGLLPAQAGALVIWHGAPDLPGAVRAYDEFTGALVAAPAELDAVELLPFDAAGRTALEEFLPTRARRLEDVAGAARLALPRLAGSLYHYARGAGTARRYGYFLVTRAGELRPLIERPGGAQNPFLERVAVAPDGRAFLCATRVAAGGDLLEVRFAGASVEVVDRSAGIPPVRLSARGLALTATHAFGLSARGLLRAPRSTLDSAELVGFGDQPAPIRYQGDLATSTRGGAVAFHAGASPAALHAWTATGTGVARRVSTQPGAHSGAGLLPAAVDGPHLAVSEDGAWCAWRVEVPVPGGLVRDAVVGRIAAPPGSQQEILTSDARFLDTLDEVAVFFFRGPSELVLAVGEQGTPTHPGIEGLDLFRARLDAAGSSTIENLTGTSGDLQEPFTALPHLNPSRWLLTPDRRSLLVHDETGSSGDLYAVDLATGATTLLLSDVKSLEWVELAGRRFAFGVQRRASSGPRPHEVHSILADLTGAPALSAWSPEAEPTQGLLARADGWVAWTRLTLAGLVLERVRVPSAAVESWPQPGGFAPGHGFTAGGAQAFGQSGAVQVWSLSGPATAWPIAGPFQVLPGT